MSDLDKRAVWPGWETVRLIGRGSFGAVYEIERDVFGHKEKAALKVITIPQSDSDIEDLMGDGYDKDSITTRFEGYLQDIVKEYSMMADMKGCANIVYCDDVKYIKHDDGIGWDIFIKMELLEALPKALEKASGEEAVIKLGADICNALAFCAKRHLLHRDIKPQNIFVAPDGTYKLGDFGIAKTAERTTSGTKTGTYKYMAPEVYNNQPYGAKADIYSLGLVLYWLLNERRTPFLPLPSAVPKASDEDAARARRFSGETIPAPAHGSDELKRIVLKACAYNPGDRYRSAEEMMRDLEGLKQGMPFAVGDVQCFATVASAQPVSVQPAQVPPTQVTGSVSGTEATVGIWKNPAPGNAHKANADYPSDKTVGVWQRTASVDSTKPAYATQENAYGSGSQVYGASNATPFSQGYGTADTSSYFQGYGGADTSSYYQGYGGADTSSYYQGYGGANTSYTPQTFTGINASYNNPAGGNQTYGSYSKGSNNKILIAAVCGGAAMIAALIVLFMVIIPSKSSSGGAKKRGSDDNDTTAQVVTADPDDDDDSPSTGTVTISAAPADDDDDDDAPVTPSGTAADTDDDDDNTPSAPAVTVPDTDDDDDEPSGSADNSDSSQSNGNVVSPTPVTPVTPVTPQYSTEYLISMDYSKKSGKMCYWGSGRSVYNYDTEGNEDWADYGTPAYYPGTVRDWEGNTYSNALSIDGDELGPYYICYNLGGKYTKFTAYIAVPESWNQRKESKQYSKYISFYCDGNLELKSKTMKRDVSRQYISIDVTGVQTLKIEWCNSTGQNCIALLCNPRVTNDPSLYYEGDCVIDACCGTWSVGSLPADDKHRYYF